MENTLTKFIQTKKGIAVLIDPDKTNDVNKLVSLIKKSEDALIDYFFVGGSTVKKSDFEKVVETLKKNTQIPVIIFPGSSNQVSPNADAILFLSLLSGRNPDYLIGLHVRTAEEILQHNLEVIPTAYLLIDGGTNSSVSYISQTSPIPRNQLSIVRKTALAGKLQGKKLIYLDAGSGARFSISPAMIEEVYKLKLPIVIGGGIKSIKQIQQTHAAGANIAVIGNHLENDESFLKEIKIYKNNTKTPAAL